MDVTYRPYFDPDYEVMMERIHPPRVCIDNDTHPETLVKVDSANKQGMLLEMVQVLTDLDLLITKSYISSDGGWLMDVFHVTDQQRNKLTDQNLIRYIQEGICASRQHGSIDHMALEVTGIERPNLISEISGVLSELRCHILSVIAWTHNGRAACIIYVDYGKVMDPSRAQAQIESVVEAHHHGHERPTVKLVALAASQTHAERRLHQLMAADGDYIKSCSCSCGGDTELMDELEGQNSTKECDSTHVKIEKYKENGYLIITVNCRDRPKLLFDTVCALTDLEYIVNHAAITSNGLNAHQEYYVKYKDGYIADLESEKCRVTQCLIAASERRTYHGLRLDICTENRIGLLSDVTQVFRENGLLITRAEMGIRGEKAIGTFYLKDESGQSVNAQTLEVVRQEIGGDCTFVEEKYLGTSLGVNSTRTGSSSSSSNNDGIEKNTRFSLGNLILSHMERLSSCFGSVLS